MNTLSYRLGHRHLTRPGRVVTATLAGPGAGLVLGLVAPRGPLSTFEGLAAMGLGLLVGTVAGLLLRSRWAMLVAPVTFAGVFELVRLRVSGPTVDGIQLDSTYGILAFATGRVVHGLLTQLPMVLGAALGAGLARRRLPTARPQRGVLSGLGMWLRRGAAITTALVLLATAAFVARPAAPAAASWSRCDATARHSKRTSWSSPSTSAAPASPMTSSTPPRH